MKLVWIVAVAVTAVVLLALFLRGRIAAQHEVRVADVPHVLDQLKTKGKNGSFAVFMFSDHGAGGEVGQVNLQFSIENNTVGLDWVLIGPINLRDVQIVADKMKRLGFHSQMREMNNVKYLRVDDGDLPLLAQRLMTELYDVQQDAAIYLVPEGFVWKP